MDLKEIGINTSNWIYLADRDYWRALVNAGLNLRVQQMSLINYSLLLFLLFMQNSPYRSYNGHDY